MLHHGAAAFCVQLKCESTIIRCREHSASAFEVMMWLRQTACGYDVDAVDDGKDQFVHDSKLFIIIQSPPGYNNSCSMWIHYGA